MLTACSSGDTSGDMAEEPAAEPAADAKTEEQEQTVPDIEIVATEDGDISSDENSLQTGTDGAGSDPEEVKEAAENVKQEVIVIDPGHSAVVAEGMEPLGPGSSEQKSADTSGTSGVSTGIPEYELTLRVSQKLKTELESRGYTVILTRETNDVPVSCVQRAETANGISADAFVRIHANGADSSSAQGAMTICITPENPFYPELYTQSRALSDAVINELCAAAGCENGGVWETDSMSGNNWSKVPATIVEMGYMTNPAEDELMARDDYQNKLTQGIANGIEAYFQGQ